MTTFDFMKLALRRWYVVLIVGACCLMGFWQVIHQPPIYTTRVTLIVLAPRSDSPNTLQASTPVTIASIAVIEVNGAPNRLRSSTDNATLVGEGVTQGTSVQLRNEGNQWAPMAPDPYIDIEAVDHNPEAVQARVDAAVADVRATTLRLERHLGVAPSQRVSFTESPPGSAVITMVLPSKGRALVVTALVTLGVTAWALTVIELYAMRLRNRRSRRRTAKEKEPAVAR